MTANKLYVLGTRVANIIVGGGGVVSLLVLFYLIHRYAWTGELRLSSGLGMILYYGLPGSLAALLFASLRLSPSFRMNLALVLLSTCISIYALEIILGFSELANFRIGRTLWFPSSTKADLKAVVETARQFGVDFDTRNKAQIIDELAQRGISAVPSSVPGGLLKKDGKGTLKSEITINGTEFLPLGGISNIVTVLCNESGKYENYESDEHGFHNPKALWNPGRLDIAAVGDSYTHGHCVPSGKNFVALIREHYPSTLNLGIAGDGPLLMLATFQEYVRFMKPKVVLWFFWEGNDVIDLRQEKNSPLLMRYLENNFSRGLVHLQPDIDAALKANFVKARKNLSQERDLPNLPEGINETAINAKRLREVSERIIKLTNLRQRLGLIYDASIAPAAVEAITEDEVKLLGKILSQAKTAADEWGGNLYFVYLPERDRYMNRRTAALDDGIRDQVLNIARSAGLLVIDINEVFQAHADPLSLFPFRRMGHYNEQGHRLVAEAVLKSIALPN
jgi:hypothetical protein